MAAVAAPPLQDRVTVPDNAMPRVPRPGAGGGMGYRTWITGTGYGIFTGYLPVLGLEIAKKDYDEEDGEEKRMLNGTVL